jgi:hypothetical protein
MRKYLIIIAVIITFYSSSEANVVPIKVDYSTETAKLRISGEITSMDVNQVKNIVQSKRAWGYFAINLDSSGGDIYAAMEIGRLIRKARAKCFIPQGAKCYSACVLVLAGAVNRFVGGEVGIHRPYSTYVGKRDYEGTQNEYRRTETAVRAYLREMNLPEQLFETMVLVPPEKIRILSYEEVEAFGLSGTDPVEQETEDAKDASNYGISKAELIRRKANLDMVCPKTFLKSPDFYSLPEAQQWERINANRDCRQAYMWGLDLPTWKARSARAIDQCSVYKTDREYIPCYVKVLRGDR